MNLFTPHPADNLLSYDGIVNDYGIIFAPQQADDYLDYLQQHIAWRHDEAVIYGKHITTARQVAWYGEQNFAYTYSGTTRTTLPWDGVLSDIKQQVEQQLATVSPVRFNSCLLNRYADGSQGMAWHSDDEASLGKDTVIAFKHKQTQEKREIMLQHGQLIVMRGSTQSHWRHAIMKSSKIQTPRINLTFRTMLPQG